MTEGENIGGKATAEELELINRFSRRELRAEEVYVFPLILCDNETDRDCERFSVSALETLAGLFIGKTGIFDHDPKGANQTARIFTAAAESDSGRRTRSGEVYSCVKAKAYLMRTEKTADLIAEIDGGIKKEVSVCCSVKREICSICGTNRKEQPCSHIKGESYGGKLCEGILDEPTDAYEWSFVAIPAQPNAGITKSHAVCEDCKGYNGREDTAEVKSLRRELYEAKAALSQARADAIAEIIRLGQFCVPAYSPETVKSLCRTMTNEQLLAFKEETRKLAKPERPQSLLRFTAGEKTVAENGRFKLKR
jgi:hypothetical protein